MTSQTVSAVFVGPSSHTASSAAEYVANCSLSTPLIMTSTPGGPSAAIAPAAAADVPAHTVLLCDQEDAVDEEGDAVNHHEPGSRGKAEHHPPISGGVGPETSHNNNLLHPQTTGSARQRQPRLSLHGKTVNSALRHPRRDARYR